MIRTKVSVSYKTGVKRTSKIKALRTFWFRNMDKGVLTNADMKSGKYVLLYLCLVLFMVVYALIILVPSVWMILMGFKSAAEIYQTPVKFLPAQIDLGKLAQVWKQMSFIKTYANTFVMAIGAVAVDVVVCGLAGYVLSRLKPKGSGVVYKVLFWMMLLPGTMRLVPLYKMFIDFPVIHVNMMNTFLPMWIMTGSAIFDIMLFKTTFDTVSNSLVEAAKIDGASNMRIFLQIMVPLSVPVIVTAAVFTFNFQFGSFFWPMLILRDEAKQVLGLQIYNLKTSSLSMDYRMLAMVFAILPQLIVFALFQKHIMGGINIGGVKG